MRIAIFSDSYWPVIDGVVTSINNFSRELAKNGHEVLIVAPKPDRLFGFEVGKGVQVEWVSSVHLPTYKSYLIATPLSGRVKKSFLSFEPDIVHVQTPFSLGWMGKRWAKKNRIPLIAHYHTLLPDFLMYLPIPLVARTNLAKRLTWKYTRFFYNDSDVVLTPTTAMKKELESHGVKKVRALSNGIDFELFHGQYRVPNWDGPFRLVFAGRLSFEKNIDVLIEALTRIRERIPSAELELIGDGPARPALAEKARALNLSEHVIFHGVLRGVDLARSIGSAHVFVTASTMETQGLSMLEAMAAGLPAVGANYLAIPEVVAEGKNGFLFTPGDALDLAEKVVRLHGERKCWADFQSSAIETARNASVEKMTIELLDVYARVAKKS